MRTRGCTFVNDFLFFSLLYRRDTEQQGANPPKEEGETAFACCHSDLGEARRTQERIRVLLGYRRETYKKHESTPNGDDTRL